MHVEQAISKQLKQGRAIIILERSFFEQRRQRGQRLGIGHVALVESEARAQDVSFERRAVDDVVVIDRSFVLKLTTVVLLAHQRDERLEQLGAGVFDLIDRNVAGVEAESAVKSKDRDWPLRG
jgi:hypothetical protein